MNVSDSERIAGWYEQRGWKAAKSVEDADEVIIVTCSVRQTAEDRVYGLANNLAKCKIPSFAKASADAKAMADRSAGKQNLKPKIILTGCMLRYPIKYLREKLPQVDEFKKISEYPLDTKYPPAPPAGGFGRAGIIHNTKQSALVPIMEGCNNFCSYCVVPFARGREVSRPMEEIVCEAQELVRHGYKEITLLGQNVNSYKKSEERKAESARLQTTCNVGQEKLKLKAKNYKTPFARLLVRLHEIEGIEKISFLTSNPWDLNDEIIEAMALPTVDRYLHLPVQSGDDEILKKMNRKYTVKQYLDLVKRISDKIPDIKIGTDIIVGFPGETEEQFQQTVDLCKKVGFVKAYVSMYSPRLQTAAYKLKDDILLKEKRRRWKILNNLINPS